MYKTREEIEKLVDDMGKEPVEYSPVDEPSFVQEAMEQNSMPEPDREVIATLGEMKPDKKEQIRELKRQLAETKKEKKKRRVRIRRQKKVPKSLIFAVVALVVIVCVSYLGISKIAEESERRASIVDAMKQLEFSAPDGASVEYTSFLYEAGDGWLRLMIWLRYDIEPWRDTQAFLWHNASLESTYLEIQES